MNVGNKIVTCAVSIRFAEDARNILYTLSHFENSINMQILCLGYL